MPEITVDNLEELKQVLEKHTAPRVIEEIQKSTNGLMVSDEQKIQEQLGDLEYELHFKELLDESPLFKLGFDPKNIYYQRNSEGYSNVPAAYYPKERTLEEFEAYANMYPSDYGRKKYTEIVNAIKNKEIPEHDFIFMSSFMLPGDKTKDYILDTKSQEGLDNAHELSSHMHEFIHRALDTVPELKKWRETSEVEQYEEILMAAFTVKYFPQLAEYERNRVLDTYGVDINRNKKQLNKWINEIETISKDVLKSKGVPEKVEQKKSIMIKPKIKPKPPIPKKSFIEMLKNLFTGE
jgi:hypothetical protein